MKKFLYVLLAMSAISIAPQAYAIDQTKDVLNITTRAFGRSIDFTSDTTTSTRDKLKLVEVAKQDAAAYVASEGKIQGPYLTKAFEFIRSNYPQAKNMSDDELAQVVLAI